MLAELDKGQAVEMQMASMISNAIQVHRAGGVGRETSYSETNGMPTDEDNPNSKSG